MTNLEKTLLDTIAYFEGTIGAGQNGYNVLFDFYTIQGWTEDTEIRHRCINIYGTMTKERINKAGFDVCHDETWNQKNGNLYTTAAGRYQYLGVSWAETTENMGIGFNAPMTRLNQDLACLYTATKKKGVTTADLEKALKSLAGFKLLAIKLKKEWESFERSLNGGYGVTIEMGYDFFKQTHDIYKNK